MGQHDEENQLDDEGFLPIDYKWLKVSFYVLVLIWLMILLREATTWEDYRDQLIPVAGIALLSVLLIFQLLRDVYPDTVDKLIPTPGDGGDLSISKMRAAGATLERTREERDRILLVMVAWVVAFPVLLYLFGFVITIPLYVFAFELYLTRDPKRSVVATIVFLALIYILFIRILGMIVWDGVLLG